MKREKEVITEFLQMYKDFPYLWDNRTVEYSNKYLRNKAYEALLKKYKELDSKATILDVKKKIEHMRTTYRREYKKVLMSKLRDDDEQHEPKLWYFEHMTFLDVLYDGKLPANTFKFESSLSHSMPKKGRTTSDTDNKEDNDDELSGNEDDDNQYQSDDNDNLSQEKEISIMPFETRLQSEFDQTTFGSEAEFFGKTIGLQLKELDETQKAIAEKLINEVIFNARFKKLTFNARLKLD